MGMCGTSPVREGALLKDADACGETGRIPPVCEPDAALRDACASRLEELPAFGIEPVAFGCDITPDVEGFP